MFLYISWKLKLWNHFFKAVKDAQNSAHLSSKSSSQEQSTQASRESDSSSSNKRISVFLESMPGKPPVRNTLFVFYIFVLQHSSYFAKRITNLGKILKLKVKLLQSVWEDFKLNRLRPKVRIYQMNNDELNKYKRAAMTKPTAKMKTSSLHSINTSNSSGRSSNIGGSNSNKSEKLTSSSNKTQLKSNSIDLNELKKQLSSDSYSSSSEISENEEENENPAHSNDHYESEGKIRRSTRVSITTKSYSAKNKGAAAKATNAATQPSKNSNPSTSSSSLQKFLVRAFGNHYNKK